MTVRVPHVSGDLGIRKKSLGLIPPRISPCAPLACKVGKVCGIFVANSADYAGFADSSGL